MLLHVLPHFLKTAATALAQYLLSQKHGSGKVRDMIVDDIRCCSRLPNTNIFLKSHFLFGQTEEIDAVFKRDHVTTYCWST